eukprot:6182358-Pleurochrysis_carterae.AAC.1
MSVQGTGDGKDGAKQRTIWLTGEAHLSAARLQALDLPHASPAATPSSLPCNAALGVVVTWANYPRLTSERRNLLCAHLDTNVLASEK